MLVRRVVTGQLSTGKSVVVADDRVEPITVGLIPGAEFHAVWGSDERPRVPSAGDRPSTPRWFPPDGGFRFGFFSLPPEVPMTSTQPPPDAAMAELRQKLPGLLETLEMDNPGMHTTDTIDFVYVVSGDLWLELDDGNQTSLQAGDCVIQNGTRHRWRNKSSAACVMAIAMIGAANNKTPASANQPLWG